MGRPLNKHLFGDNADNNIKVQFHNGTESVRGFIVRQRSNLKFLCQDENGVQAVCKLVTKTSGNLQAGEMSITVKYDDSTIRQVLKIAKNLITVNLQENDVAPYEEPLYWKQAGWNFSTSTTDQKWQIEEAGTDAVMDNATDLEGDDIAYTLPPGMSLYEPYDGSGGDNLTVPGADYVLTGSASGLNASYGTRGTPYQPGGFVTTVSNSVAGLYREKYVGNIWSTYQAFEEFDITWFDTKSRGPFAGAVATPYFGFGNRTDLGNENHYTLQWRGYFQAPASGDFNVWTSNTVDDDAGVWVGSAALAPTYANANAFVGGDRLLSANSVTLVAGKWYPIRMVFTEFGGAEACQFALQDATNQVVYSGLDLTFAYNSVTKGY